MKNNTLRAAPSPFTREGSQVQSLSRPPASIVRFRARIGQKCFT